MMIRPARKRSVIHYCKVQEYSGSICYAPSENTYCIGNTISEIDVSMAVDIQMYQFIRIRSINVYLTGAVAVALAAKGSGLLGSSGIYT
jgi:hypothetical protein